MIEHKYGPRIHILSDTYLLALLGRLCAKDSTQPEVNTLVEKIYRGFLQTVVNAEFPTETAQIQTRMFDEHPEAVWRGPVFAKATKAVTVNMARAGTLPSHICYSELNGLLNPSNVRQDHISIARNANPAHEVTGSTVSGHKIGGPVDGAHVLIPDPMAATGSSMVETLKLYRGLGKPTKVIAMHCIITPEYLKRVTKDAPDLTVYAIRLDRGLSKPDILKTVPGTHWDQEKGLNSHSYIVPGGGGFGEVMNNSWV